MLLSLLSPPRFHRFRTVFPDGAGLGFTPARQTKAASLRTRSSREHAIKHFAAVTARKPFFSSRGAASLTVTSWSNLCSLEFS